MAELNSKFVSKFCVSNVENWDFPYWLVYLTKILEKMNEQKAEYVELILTPEILNELINALNKRLKPKEILSAIMIELNELANE